MIIQKRKNYKRNQCENWVSESSHHIGVVRFSLFLFTSITNMIFFIPVTQEQKEDHIFKQGRQIKRKRCEIEPSEKIIKKSRKRNQITSNQNVASARSTRSMCISVYSFFFFPFFFFLSKNIITSLKNCKRAEILIFVEGKIKFSELF